MKNLRKDIAVLLLILVPMAGAQAQTTWNAGGAADKEWETSGWTNWSTGASPSGQNVFFGNAGATSTSSTVTNIVDQDFTIGSLTYNQDTTAPTNNNLSWQNTQINNGVTLTVGGGLTIGGATIGTAIGSSASPVTTNTSFSGTGTLTINAAGSDINVWNARTTGSVGAPSATLNLSGLSTFNATVANINIGYGTNAIGTVSLANTANTITASTLSVGNGAGNIAQGTGTLHLGAGSNVLNVDNIYVGSSTGTNYNGSYGTLDFLTGTGTVTIRGQSGGTSRANLTIGSQRMVTSSGTNIGGNPVGVVDFGTHVIDARINTLIVGSAAAGSGSVNPLIGATGTLTMGAGTMDVTTANIAQSLTNGNTNANPVSGTLNINGGTFTATTVNLGYNVGGSEGVNGTLNIAGGTSTINSLVLGIKAGSTATSVTSTVTVSGGSLTLNTNLAEGSTTGGTTTSTLTVSGGALDMTNHSITVDTFNLQSGTLSNVTQINAGGTVTKTTGGTLTLSGTNAYSGNTVVSAGTLLVTGALSNSSVTVQNTGTLGGSGTITNAVSVESGGTVAPGVAGTLSTGNFSLTSGAALSMQLNSAIAGTGYGQVSVTGAVNLNSDAGVGSNLVLALNYAPVMSETFTLIANDGSDAITGLFATINGGAFGVGNTFSLIYNSQSYDFTLSYTGGTGNDLVIQAVPEPSTLLIVALAGVIAVVLRRRIGRVAR